MNRQNTTSDPSAWKSEVSNPNSAWEKGGKKNVICFFKKIHFQCPVLFLFFKKEGRLFCTREKRIIKCSFFFFSFPPDCSQLHYFSLSEKKIYFPSVRLQIRLKRKRKKEARIDICGFSFRRQRLIIVFWHILWRHHNFTSLQIVTRYFGLAGIKRT